MEPGQRALEDSTFAARYELGAVIGRGGMGVVYRALDRELKRPLAIKLLHTRLLQDENSRQRFLAEARLCAGLAHPAVVRVFEVEAASGVPYIATELVDGRALSEVLRERGRLPRAEWLPIAAQIVEGLAAVHAAGIVHRDLKPGNVLVVPGPPPVVKLADFGIAKALHDDPAMDAEGLLRSTTGMLVGTPEYMSPEQAQGEPLSPASDLYALGIVIHRMVVGEPLFSGTSLVEVLRRHVEEVPRLPADLDPRLAALLAGLLAKDPAARPRGVEVRQALEQLEVGAHPAARERSARTPRVEPDAAMRGEPSGLPRRRPRAVGVLALVVAGAVWALRPAAPDDAPAAPEAIAAWADARGTPDPARLFELLRTHRELPHLSIRQVVASAAAQAADRALLRLLADALTAAGGDSARLGCVQMLTARLRDTLGRRPADVRGAQLALDDWAAAAEHDPQSDAACLPPAGAIAWLREVVRLRTADELPELLRALRRVQICGLAHPGAPLAARCERLAAAVASGGELAGARAGPLDEVCADAAADVVERWVRGPHARLDRPRFRRAVVLSSTILRVVSKDSGTPWTERWEVPVKVRLDLARRQQPDALAAVQGELGGAEDLSAETPLSDDAVRALAGAFGVDLREP